MQTTESRNAFNVVGLSIRTSNENFQAAEDIGQLWQKFMSDQVTSKIENKVSEEIYCIYTEYEGDHSKPYTVLLGYEVTDLEHVNEGLRGMSFGADHYKKFTFRGNILQGLLMDAWQRIWNSKMNRAYRADFELYGAQAQSPEDTKVDIYISINNS